MMNPDLLAHLCKLIGYLEGSDIEDVGLQEYINPIETIVDKEIAAFNMPDGLKMEACLHFGAHMPEKCECDDDCPCKQGGCSPINPSNLDEDGFTRSAIFCEHANECPSICPCADNCYCKKHTCKPRALMQLPPGIVAKGGGTANGINFKTQEEEAYYHCPDVCQGWHKGEPRRERDGKGISLLCIYCGNIVARAETRKL